MEFHYEILEPKILLYKDEDEEQEEVQKLKKELDQERQSKEEMKKENELMFKDVLERLRIVEEKKSQEDISRWKESF